MAPRLIAAVAALGVGLAGPALAQSQQGSQSGSGPSSSQGHQARSSGQHRQQGQIQQQATSQERLRQQLTQAGFRDVQILDAAYLVQARTQNGSTVLMTINPPSAGSQVSATSGGSSSGSESGSGGSASGSGSSGSGGSQSGRGSSGSSR